jgi:hypothetical protein
MSGRAKVLIHVALALLCWAIVIFVVLGIGFLLAVDGAPGVQWEG